MTEHEFKDGDKEDLPSKVQKEVCSLYKKHANSLLSDVERLSYLTPTQQWLVYGRVVQLLFQMHFKMAYTASEKSLDQAAKLGHTSPERDRG